MSVYVWSYLNGLGTQIHLSWNAYLIYDGLRMVLSQWFRYPHPFVLDWVPPLILV